VVCFYFNTNFYPIKTASTKKAIFITDSLSTKNVV